MFIFFIQRWILELENQMEIDQFLEAQSLAEWRTCLQRCLCSPFLFHLFLEGSLVASFLFLWLIESIHGFLDHFPTHHYLLRVLTYQEENTKTLFFFFLLGIWLKMWQFCVFFDVRFCPYITYSLQITFCKLEPLTINFMRYTAQKSLEHATI